MLRFGVVNNRSYEPILNGYTEGKVDCAVLLDVIAFPRSVDLRNPSYCYGAGFKNEIVYCNVKSSKLGRLFGKFLIYCGTSIE